MSARHVELRNEDITPRSGAVGVYAPLAIGVGALGLSLALGSGDMARFYHSYLVAFMYCLSLALGGLFFVLVHHLTQAGWSVVVRRLAEHLAGTLPLFALLFVPIALGLHELYHWTHGEAVAHDPLLTHKAPYLDQGFFFARAAVFLAGWAVLGWWFRKTSMRQDERGDLAASARMRTWAPIATIFFALSLTYASVDWMMSLDPHWYSTMFGVYYFAGAVVSMYAVLIVLLALQQRGGRLQVVSVEHLHDLGKLLFGFTVFWAYIAFSQFMLIWYANIPEETLWFAHRWEHGWKQISIFLAVGHFGLPFFYLMSRAMKRRMSLLLPGAVWLLLMHYLDMYWLVMPGFRPEQGFSPQLVDLATLLAVGGLFAACLGQLMRGGKLLPASDPRLTESLSFENF